MALDASYILINTRKSLKLYQRIISTSLNLSSRHHNSLDVPSQPHDVCNQWLMWSSLARFPIENTTFSKCLELSQLYSIQKDEGGLCTRDLNGWYEWRRYCHITGCNRGTRYTKQKYSIGDHILEGFGTFGSLPTRLQTACWFSHHATTSPWPRGRVDAPHNLRRKHLNVATNDEE